MTKQTLYKVTTANLEAAHGGNFTYTPGEWTPEISNPALCERGYHLTSKPMDWAKVGMRAWETEYKGLSDETDDDQHKRVASSIRLTNERPDLIPDWWRDVEQFVAQIPGIPWLSPQGDPDSAWRVFDTRDAARDAAWGAARDAAGDAAWGAARDAARAAARAAARDASRDASRDAAMSAAWTAAWDAAWDAAWNAAWDAALQAQIIICGGLDLDERHIRHSQARMDVWRRGYGLLDDVNGELFCYRSIS